MSISEKIFNVLKEKGITQKQFSQRTGISQSVISDWKRKSTNPAADKILIICETLDISPYELLSGTENANFKQTEQVVIDKKSQDYIVLEAFQSLDPQRKNRLMGYIQALKED